MTSPSGVVRVSRATSVSSATFKEKDVSPVLYSACDGEEDEDEDQGEKDEDRGKKKMIGKKSKRKQRK